MSKPFGLVLALAAAGAHAEAGGESGLVVSALFGTEPPAYVHAAVANVLGVSPARREWPEADRGSRMRVSS